MFRVAQFHMLIPKSYPARQRLSIRKCFFGIGENISLAIFTPLRNYFNLFKKYDKICNGWWECYYDKNTIISLVPQSTAVLDAISSLEPHTKIIFLGLAGSFGSLKIGDIVEASSAQFGTEIFQRNFNSNYLFHPAKIATVSSIAASWYFKKKLSNKVDCVDMETAYLYAASKLQNKYVTSILMISDIIPSIPFYKININCHIDKFEIVYKKIESVL